MESHKTSSKDIARLMIALVLLAFSTGVFGFLLFRFGPNPMAHKNSVTLSQLFGLSKESEVSQTPESGQVAGATNKNAEGGFRVDTVQQATDPSKPNTVSMVRVENTVLLRYNEDLFVPQVGYEPVLAQVENKGVYPWAPLVTAPESVGGVNELFSFMITPDTNTVAFVMKWGSNSVENGTRYEVFIFDEYASGTKIKKIASFGENRQKPSTPKISSLSPDGRYLSMAMFTCYECGGEIPVTVVVDTVSGEVKNIGRTSSFTWAENGKYTYTEYVEVACPDNSNAKCAIDPQFLDSKTGTI
jgi:hypothetical protein